MKILIIEDDRELCEEVSEILIDEGHHVDVAYDRKSAEKNIRQNIYDISLLDLRIPGGGIKILEKAKREIPDLKIILFTASPEVREIINNDSEMYKKKNMSILRSADAFISKPFEIERLLETINKMSYQTV